MFLMIPCIELRNIAKELKEAIQRIGCVLAAAAFWCPLGATDITEMEINKGKICLLSIRMSKHVPKMVGIWMNCSKVELTLTTLIISAQIFKLKIIVRLFKIGTHKLFRLSSFSLQLGFPVGKSLSWRTAFYFTHGRNPRGQSITITIWIINHIQEIQTTVSKCLIFWLKYRYWKQNLRIISYWNTFEYLTIE